jgi:hypothetical protein
MMMTGQMIINTMTMIGHMIVMTIVSLATRTGETETERNRHLS